MKVRQVIAIVVAMGSATAYADSDGIDWSDFQLKRAFIEGSGGKVRTKNNYTVGDYGWATGGRAGFDAQLPNQFYGGLSFMGVHSAGNGSFGSQQSDEQRNAYGPSLYLQRHIWGPTSLGVTGSYLWMKGRNLNNLGAHPGINKLDEFSHQTSWGIYALNIVPLTPRWAVQFTPAFNRTDGSAHFIENDPAIQSSSLSAFNLVTTASYQTPWDVRLDFGTIFHRAITQGQPGTSPTHSLMWLTPVVGLNYAFAPKWTAYSRFSYDTLDRAYDSWTVMTGFARSF